MYLTYLYNGPAVYGTFLVERLTTYDRRRIAKKAFPICYIAENMT